MKQYSADLRERLLGAIDGGLPVAEAARLFRVCPSTTVRWRRRQRSTGTVAARSRPGRPRASVPRTLRPCGPRSLPPPTPPWLSIAPAGLRSRGWLSAWPPCRGSSTASGSRSKKVLHARERDEEERAAWWAETAHLDPATLVFVDESGTNVAMTPRYGRAPRGQRVVGVVPRNHGPNVTLLAAMSHAGITAAMNKTAATDGAVFALFVGQILVPSLQPGQVVIWDNLSVHRNQKLRRSIEHAFSKLKTALRQAGARERAGLEDAIAAGLATITAEDAAGWFGHCGYAASEHLF